MIPTRYAIFLLTCFGVTSICEAQIITKMPNKGDWAKYDLKGTVGTPGADGDKQKIEGEITIRLLGSEVDENMQTYRWLELEAKVSAPDSPEESNIGIAKILVLESGIANGKSMAGKIKKCYMKEGDDAGEVKDVGPDSIQAKQFTAMLWPEKIQSKKELPETAISVGADTFQSKGISFVVPQPVYTVERKMADGEDDKDFEDEVTETGETIDVNVTVYSSDKSPFGLVQFKASMEQTVMEDFKIFMEFEGTLVETGTGAESALRDHK